MSKQLEKATIARLQRIGKTISSLGELQNSLYRQVAELDQHYHNRIAAHKAHVTMAKQKAVRLKVVKIKGI